MRFSTDSTHLDQPEIVPMADGQNPGSQHPRVNILGSAVDAINFEQALSLIAARLESGYKGYVCAVGVHGILEALRDRQVAGALAGAALALPDGTPLAWVGGLHGHRTMTYVTGPAVMRAILRRSEFSEYSHFFYGGKPGVVEDLVAKIRIQHPRTKILGTYTPPFRPLTRCEESQLVQRINQLRPDIIWVGISTPRQDIFMQQILPHLRTRMMFGVGAAFDFLAGRIRDCPEWVKRAGFQWLHRLVQDPRRLWLRNLKNTAFLWHISLQLSGLREYPLQSPDMSRKDVGKTLPTPDWIG